jgi:hypothetical protein
MVCGLRPFRIPHSALRIGLRGQSTLEYALFVAVAASALAGMTVYVRRSIQANLKAIEDRINADALPRPEEEEPPEPPGIPEPPPAIETDPGNGG